MRNNKEEQKDAAAPEAEPIYSDYIEEGTVFSGALIQKRHGNCNLMKSAQKISSDFSKLIGGVSDIDSLPQEDREIIDRIQEISALLNTGKEDIK